MQQKSVPTARKSRKVTPLGIVTGASRPTSCLNPRALLPKTGVRAVILLFHPSPALQVNQSVMEQPQLHSLLPLPGITAVPGDRFKELYYWDSFWVIKGLLVSGMTETAMSEVRNLLSLLETYGHVPNGARVYYINRR